MECAIGDEDGDDMEVDEEEEEYTRAVGLAMPARPEPCSRAPTAPSCNAPMPALPPDSLARRRLAATSSRATAWSSCLAETDG